ncbi:MAG: formylglycine-generating enzyme family protein [Myxococcales bacterium]
MDGFIGMVLSTMNCTVDRLVVSLVAAMVRILAGPFIMGGGPEADEQPRRTVVVSAFSIDVDEVTRAEYAVCVQAGVCRAASGGRADDATSKLPVTGVSWSDADTYCRWAQKRLPTEAEWERAARGDDGRRFPWGDEWVPALAAHRGGARHTLPVRSLPQNRSPHGLYDCAGNVWDWCSDWFAPGLKSARGGAWNAHPPQLRCASRNAWPPEARFSNLGFRVCQG